MGDITLSLKLSISIHISYLNDTCQIYMTNVLYYNDFHRYLRLLVFLEPYVNTVNSRDKFEKPRLALRKLINSLIHAYERNDGHPDGPYNPLPEFLANLSTRGDKPASRQTLYNIYNGKSPNFIKPIAHNIAKFLDGNGYTDIKHQELLWTILDEVDPDFCPKFSHEFLRYRIKRAKKVRIFNNYLPLLEHYVDLLKEVEDLQIVIMSPESIYLNDRAIQLEKDMQFVHGRIASNMSSLEQNDVPKDSVRQFEGMPRNPFYIFDEDIFCGFFLSEKEAVNAPFRKFSIDSDEGELLYDEYDLIWGKSYETSLGNQTQTAVPKDTQMLSALFPSLREQMSGDKLQSISKRISGVYQFSRYRRSHFHDVRKASASNSLSKFKHGRCIVTGIMQIYGLDDYGAISFSATLPHPTITETNRLPVVNGRVLPFKNSLFLIGETSGKSYENRLPVFFGMKSFERTESNVAHLAFQALLLRQQKDDDISTKRVIFRPVPETDLRAATNRYMGRGFYRSETEFLKEFNVDPKYLKLDKNNDVDLGMLVLRREIERNSNIFF